MNQFARHTLQIALSATLAALLIGGKEALAFIPNVEIVTITIILAASALGLYITMPAVFVFVTVEMAIYGMGSWVFSYFVYWPLLAVGAYVMSRFVKWDKAWAYAVFAALMCVLFGLITTLVDTIVSGAVSRGVFFRVFGAMYIRGILFFALQIVSNFIIVLFLYKPLYKQLFKLKAKYLL